MREVKYLTTGPISGHLFRLAMPILGTSFIQMLYSFTDMGWLGRVNNQAVAAVGAVSMFAWLGNSIALINKVGSEVVVAHAIGSNDEKQAADYASHTSTMGVMMGVMMMLLYLVFPSLLLKVYDLEAPIHAEAVQYMMIIAVGMPFIFTAAAYTGIYNATGHSNVPFKISAMGLVLNMVLDPLFIFGLHLGSAGAGYATVLSQLFVMVMFIYQIRVKDQLFGGLALWIRLKWLYVRQILHIGVPVALLNSLFAFINMYMGRLASLANGHIGVLTLTTGGQLEAITWNTAQGFSTALSTIVSQNYGARKIGRVFSAYRFTLLMTMSFGVFSSLLYIFGGEQLFGLIVPDPIAYQAGGLYMRINGYTQLFMMLELTSQGFFYGIRRGVPPAAISIGGNLLRIPLALFFLAHYPSIETLWWVISFSSFIKGTCAIAWFFVERHRLLKSETSVA